MTVSACANEFVRVAELELTGGDPGLSNEDIAQVLTAAVRLYAARAESRDEYPPPLTREKITATDVAVTVSEMARVADLNMFDLSMWHGRTRGRSG
jgi:hypothetical protein